MLSKTGIKLLVVYLVLILSAYIYLLMTEETNAFAYLYLIILTLPWSQLLAMISLFSEAIGQLSTTSKAIIFGIFIIINSIIIYLIGIKYDQSNNKN